LADDLMDLQGVEEKAGKPLGVDWRQRRATLPLIHALRMAPPAVAREIRALWLHEPFTNEQFSALCHLVEACGGFETGWRKVKEYQEIASACLDNAPAGMGRDALVALCREVFPLPLLPATV